MAFFARRNKQQPKTKYYVLNQSANMAEQMSRREQVEVLRATLYSLADSLADGHHSDEQLRALDAEVARVSNVPPPPAPVPAPAQEPEPAPVVAPVPAQAQAPVHVLPLNPFSRFAAPAPLYVAPAAPAPAAPVAVRAFPMFGLAPAPVPAQAQAAPRRVGFAPGTALAPAPAPVAPVVFGFGPAPAPSPAEAATRWLAVGAHRYALAERYAQRYRVSVDQAAYILDSAESRGVHPDPLFERVVRRVRERAAKKPSKKTTVVKIADLAMVNPDSCAVCMENHCKGDEVVTNCGHRFGSACFAQWETTQLRSNMVTCPCCRVNVTQLTGFRRRAAPQKKGK